MKRETRTGEIRATGGDGRTFEVLAVAYDVVDDYGTSFVPGVFADSLERRLPVLAWSHDWSEPIGRATAYRDADEGLYLTFRFSDPDAVPRARQAMAQVRDGDLTDVSVGFMRLADNTRTDGVVEITKGELDEVSIVLRGAVPGARVLAGSVRASVSFDAVVELAKRKASGELSLDEAKAALELIADEDGDSDDGGDPVPAEPDPTPDADDGGVELDAEIADALDMLDRSR